MSRTLEIISLDPEAPALKAIETDLGSFLLADKHFSNLSSLQTYVKGLVPKYMIIDPNE